MKTILESMAFGVSENGIPPAYLLSCDKYDQRVLWRPSAQLNDDGSGFSAASVQVNMISNLGSCCFRAS